MPASEAQVRANRENSKLAKGATTPAGRAASSANALKHGLTATKCLPEREAAEVERRFEAYCQELKPTGEVGLDLARRAATLAVRMERCVEYENAHAHRPGPPGPRPISRSPEGVDEATAAQLRDQAGKRALFDDLQASHPRPEVRGRRRTRLPPLPQGVARPRTGRRGAADADEILGQIGFVFAGRDDG